MNYVFKLKNLSDLEIPGVVVNEGKGKGKGKDPRNQFANFETQYECWINYYNNRRDADHTIAWHKDTVPHPVQEDYFNCGVFTVNFITDYINKGKIDFKTTPDQLFVFRKQIANDIKKFYS